MKQVSKIVDGVRCVIGQATKKPNTITMTISGKFAIEAVEYFEALRKGDEITEGLDGLVLMAHYAEDADESSEEESDLEVSGEDVILDLTETLDKVLEDDELIEEEGDPDRELNE